MVNKLRDMVVGLFQRMRDTLVVKPVENLDQRINNTRISGTRLKALHSPMSTEEKLKKPCAINARITSTRLQALQLKSKPEIKDRNVNERFVLADHLDKVASE